MPNRASRSTRRTSSAPSKRELVQKAMACGRKALDGLISIVTVDTLLRW